MIPISYFSLPVSSEFWPESKIAINGPGGRLDLHFHPMVFLTFPQPDMGNFSRYRSFDSCEEVAPLIIRCKIRTFSGQKLVRALSPNACSDVGLKNFEIRDLLC